MLIDALHFGCMCSMTVVHHGTTVERNNHKACVVCHDSKGCAEAAHPMNIAYPTGNSKSFHEIAYVRKKGLRLVDGKITCLSCHDLANDLSSHLAITNVGSQLCMVCHRM